MPQLQLPLQVPVQSTNVMLTVDHAVVDVFVSDQEEAGLLVQLLRGEEGEQAQVGLRQSGHETEVRRIGDQRRALYLRVTIGSHQRLLVTGSRLGLTVAGEGVEEGSRAQEQASAPLRPAPAQGSPSANPTSNPSSPGVELHLAGSEVAINDVGPLRIQGVDSSFQLDRTYGPLSLHLRGGLVESRAHGGRVELDAENAEIGLRRLRGAIQVRGVDCSTLLEAGQGDLKGSLQGGQLQVLRRQGVIDVHGISTNVELIASGRARANIVVRGEDLDLSLERIGSPVQVSMQGGRLRGSQLSGQTIVEARDGADVDLSRAMGGLQLTLSGGANASLSTTRKPLRLTLQSASIDLLDIGRLALTAMDSEITGSEVRRLDQLEINGSRLDLSLADEAPRSVKVVLRRRSEGRLELPAPCVVNVAGRALGDGERLRVNGCTLGRRGQGRRRLSGRGLEGERALTLEAQVGPESFLEVDGRS